MTCVSNSISIGSIETTPFEDSFPPTPAYPKPLNSAQVDLYNTHMKKYILLLERITERIYIKEGFKHICTKERKKKKRRKRRK